MIDVDQKTVIVTGANRGIGRGITSALAKDGYHIIMACRDVNSADETCNQIIKESGNTSIETCHLELSSFGSVLAFADTIEGRKITIQALINNAGILCDRFQETIDGFESTIHVNYISQFLLTMLLLPCLSSEQGRIINTSSIMYKLGRVDSNFFSRSKESYNKFRVYSDSKLALLLFSLELAERTADKGILVNSVDPGVVNTNILTMGKWYDPVADIIFRPFVKSEKKGAETAVFVATHNNCTGKFYFNKKERKIPSRYMYHSYRKELWDETVKMLESKGITI